MLLNNRENYDKIETMNKEESSIISFLKEVMRRRKKKPSQLARDLGVSHATVIRWLSGKDIPSTRSCNIIARYSGVSSETVMSYAGHLTETEIKPIDEWPEFREYARIKYPHELDEDLVTMIEDLIERRRGKNHGQGKQ